LAFFKYSAFFLPRLASVPGLQGLGPLKALVPVGLSFWTLQKMTLTLDVYYRRRKAERSYLRCLLFTGFFPTLLSGPIERSRVLLPLFAKDRAWDPRAFSEGVWWFALGAFQKAVLADNVATVAESLLKPGTGGLAVLAGMWAYAIQLYADFAGYSYMARGCARMLGLDIAQNFTAPFLTRNIADFWKQWHISLSGWLNEYVYAPCSMALRNLGTAGIVLSLWATFVASGLWHGTGWTYFAYGCLHAFGLSVYTLSKRRRKALKERFRDAAWLRGLAILVTFHFVALSFLLFRSAGLAEFWALAKGMMEGPWIPAVKIDWPRLALGAAPVFALQWALSRTRDVHWVFARPVWVRVALYVALGFLMMRYYAPSDHFIYQQF
jgi:D-alanyl-lipoteichoic acid acyltransferase DltB (MBOAT superfamily)